MRSLFHLARERTFWPGRSLLTPRRRLDRRRSRINNEGGII